LEHRASNPVSVKHLTAIETSIIVKLLRSYVPVGTKRTRRRMRNKEPEEHRTGAGKLMPHLSNAFTVILHTSLAMTVIYCTVATIGT
jgi:hypothetical protein